MEKAIVVISEMKDQFGEWNEQIMRIQMSDNKWITFHSSYMSLVSCIDYNHPKTLEHIKKEDQETYKMFWIISHFKKCQFEKCMKLVAEKIPNQEEKITRMNKLYAYLKPIWSSTVFDFITNT